MIEELRKGFMTGEASLRWKKMFPAKNAEWVRYKINSEIRQLSTLAFVYLGELVNMA